MKIRFTLQPEPGYDQNGPLELSGEVSWSQFQAIEEARSERLCTMTLLLAEGSGPVKETHFSPCLIVGQIDVRS